MSLQWSNPLDRRNRTVHLWSGWGQPVAFISPGSWVLLGRRLSNMYAYVYIYIHNMYIYIRIYNCIYIT